MTPMQMANVAQVSQLAAKLGYWVILPAAKGIWNINPNQSYGTDDIGFVSAVINKMVSDYPVDKTRVSLAGFSKGAYLAEVIACAHPELLASVSLVSGTMTTPDVYACKPSRPLPITYIMGTADPRVSYDGAYGQYSAPQDFSYWGGMLACDMSRETTADEPAPVNDGTMAKLQHLGNCTAGGEVNLYTVLGGGHAWPGNAYPNPGLGTVSQNLNATMVIGQFASKYTTSSTH
jgi:polyhydroxybutyrate depolymerase